MNPRSRDRACQKKFANGTWQHKGRVQRGWAPSFAIGSTQLVGKQDLPQFHLQMFRLLTNRNAVPAKTSVRSCVVAFGFATRSGIHVPRNSMQVAYAPHWPVHELR